MQNLKLALCLLIVVMAAASFQQSFELSASASQTQDKPFRPKPDDLLIGCSVIDLIDDCIQEMFSKADLSFGMARVPVTNRHLNYFHPSTEKEKAAVTELDKNGWLVAFYLAGRKVLGEKPDANVIWVGRKHSIIGGPIAINPEYLNRGHLNEDLGMPEPGQLWDDAQKAMRAFETRDRYDFSAGKWEVEARPIRAQEACLKCHFQPPVSTKNIADVIKEAPLNFTTVSSIAPSKTPVKVGDALGVAMYAYTRKN